MRVFSFDRDNCLQPWGGPITRETLIKLKRLDCIIGTGGGATADEQRSQWQEWGIEPDFAFTKGDLGKLREMYPDTEITHIGDDLTDKVIAQQFNYTYLTPAQFMGKYG